MAKVMEYSAENVEKAVSNFYSNVGLQQEVHQWLNSAQVSHEAWSFCWELMAQGKDVQVQYFGASTLHVKISRYWNELPPDQYESLKNKVVEHVINFGNGPKLILTKLCIALSSLALHSMPESWQDPIHSLIATFQEELSPLTSTQRCSVLLEILTVLPEEFFTANLTNARRNALRAELNQGLTKILALLTTLMSGSSPGNVFEHALRCFSSWVEFGVPMNEAEEITIQVFQALNNTQLFETAVDTLVGIFSHADSHRFPYTIQKFLPTILQLHGMLNTAISDHDMDVCQGITQIVVSVAENHTKLILDCAYGEDENKKSDIHKLVQLVLACSCIPGHYPVDETCSSMTFTFWYILQDNLLELDMEKYQTLLPVFQPIYLGLIENLLIKVQYPADEVFEAWTAEDKEQFRCYRQDIGDTMMYAYSILREPLLGHLCKALASIIQTNKELDYRWQLMEAIFFLFASVSESVDLEENLYLPSLLELLPKIPFNNIKFISTALYMLGSFGEWMKYHPTSLATAIPLLLQGLSNPEVAMPATMALKDITRENLEHIQPYIQQILQASQNALESGNLKIHRMKYYQQIITQTILKSFREFRENVRLMTCLGQVLSVLPFNDILENLKPILTPQVQQLEQLAKEKPSASVKNALLLKLNMLSWMFASLDTDIDAVDRKKKHSTGPKPVYMILQQIAPILHTIVSTWITDAGVVEAICELFKRSLQTLMDDFAPLSKDVGELLAQMYQAVPHIAILDLTKQLIVMFHNDAVFSGVVKVLLNSVCSKTLELFQGDIHQNTDIVEAFMTLLSQVLKKTKKNMVIDETSDLKGLFHAGIVGMSLPENHTVKASCMFLNGFVSMTEVAAFTEVVTTQGNVLLDRIMRAIGGESPRMVMENVADVLFNLCKNYLQPMRQWSQEIIDKDGYPCSRCSRSDKENFIKSILRERINNRRVRELVKEFTLLCRGLLGTEYAAEMVRLM